MKEEIFFGLLIALILAILISPFASKRPDGLEKVAKDKGFIEKGEGTPILPIPMPDYTFPWIKNEKITTSIAGMSGALIVFLLFIGLFRRKR